MKKFIIWVSIISLSLGGVVSGACPSSDLSGDCRVNLEDLAVMASGWMSSYSYDDLYGIASEWMTEGNFDDPKQMVWVEIDDPGVDEDGDGEPDHEGFNGQMSRFETTNGQFCAYLNAALASDDIYVGQDHKVYGKVGSNDGEDFPYQIYFATFGASKYSQIDYTEGKFTVRSRNAYSMVNHPIVEVTWLGATAFCNYYGYRLPTEWQWQAVADYDGSYTHGCGETIDFSRANYYSNDFAKPLEFWDYPYTSPVNYYPAYGYGINDMAGNVMEWTSSVYEWNPEFRILRGSSWFGISGTSEDNECTVWDLNIAGVSFYGHNKGFRVCR